MINNPLLNNPLATTSALPYEEEGLTPMELLNSSNFWAEGDYAGMTLAEEAAARNVALNVVRKDRRQEREARAILEAAPEDASFSEYINATTEAASGSLFNTPGSGTRLDAFDSGVKGRQHQAVVDRAEQEGMEPFIVNGDGTVSVLNTGFGTYNAYSEDLSNYFGDSVNDRASFVMAGEEAAPGEYTTYKMTPVSKLSQYGTLATTVAAGLVTGGALAPVLGGSGIVSGAAQGAVGSAISQGIVTGSVDPTNLVKAAITGGIGGLATDLADGVLEGTQLDEAVWAMSDTLGTDYSTTLDIITGVANGVVNGGQVEDIALGAVSGWSQSKVKDFLSESFGDTVDIDNFFKEGDANIPVEAFDPVIKAGFEAAIKGGMNTEDVLKTAFDYFSAGGNLGFLEPEMVDGEFKDWLGSTLPDISFEKGDWGVTQQEDGDYTISGNVDFLPAVDLPNVELPNIDLPNVELPNVDLPNVDLPQVNLDIPDVELPNIDIPDVDLPQVNLDIPEVGLETPELPSGPDMPELPDAPDVPELPDTPSGMLAGGGGAGGGSFAPKWSELFQYTTLTPYQKKQLAPYKDYVQQAKGMLS